MTWVAVMFGLLANSAEGAGVFSYILLGLLFISSGFAPTKTMPRFIRSLMLNDSVVNNAFIAVLWCVGILIASYIIAMQIYKHKGIVSHV
ncbi:MAG: hypothetical protein H7Y18_17935 [Clostridiaceae bacterium]|nr:hypothetical protein [Clostridiaceae bacterium]